MMYLSEIIVLMNYYFVEFIDFHVTEAQWMTKSKKKQFIPEKREKKNEEITKRFNRINAAYQVQFRLNAYNLMIFYLPIVMALRNVKWLLIPLFNNRKWCPRSGIGLTLFKLSFYATIQQIFSHFVFFIDMVFNDIFCHRPLKIARCIERCRVEKWIFVNFVYRLKLVTKRFNPMGDRMRKGNESWMDFLANAPVTKINRKRHINVNFIRNIMVPSIKLIKVAQIRECKAGAWGYSVQRLRHKYYVTLSIPFRFVCAFLFFFGNLFKING